MNKPEIQEVVQIVADVKDRMSAYPLQYREPAVVAVLAFYELLKRDEKALREPKAAEYVLAFPVTFLDWTEEYNLVGHREKFLAVALYIVQEKNVPTFTVSDLLEYYKKARWAKPQNPADIIGKAANVGYLTEADSSDSEGYKVWQLTHKGYKFVQSLKRQGGAK